METQNKTAVTTASLNFITTMSNIVRRIALPDGCQFLAANCGRAAGQDFFSA
jgi:hypothetical protein